MYSHIETDLRFNASVPIRFITPKCLVFSKLLLFIYQMPPKKRVLPGKAAIESVVEEVLKNGQPIRSIPSAYEISKWYFADIIKKARGCSTTYSYDPNIGTKIFFSYKQDDELADYLIWSLKICYELTTIQLTYQFRQRMGSVVS